MNQPEIIGNFKWPSIRIFPLDKIPSLKPAINLEFALNAVNALKTARGCFKHGTEMSEFNYQECIKGMCCSEMCLEKAIKLENSTV